MPIPTITIANTTMVLILVLKAPKGFYTTEGYLFSMELSKEKVLEKLKEVTDPEMHINIVDLGLVYDVILDKGMVTVTMTLTSPACPVGPMILDSVEENVKGMPGVKGVIINIVWDPPWNPDKMSEEAKMELGIM